MSKFKTWGEFAKNYDLVLFNNCVNLVNQDNTSFFEGVIMEWHEKHLENCEYEIARNRIEELEDSEDKKEIKEREGLIEEYGESPECQCEPMQWYAIAIGEWDQKHLNETYKMDIFYSDTLDLYILPVYHFGTGWDCVNL